MCQPTASEARPAPFFGLPFGGQSTIRHILLGDYQGIIETINHIVALGYCDRIAWSDPYPTGREGEYISIMTHKRSRS